MSIQINKDSLSIVLNRVRWKSIGKAEPDCLEGVRAQLERMKKLCKERNHLYKKQNKLKVQKEKTERELE